MTIRMCLERDTESTATETLEISRLRRENEALLKIMGQLTCRAELREKNLRRGRHQQERSRQGAWSKSLKSLLPHDKGSKKIRGDFGEVELETSREREGRISCARRRRFWGWC
jgi:hypothetical protein